MKSDEHIDENSQKVLKRLNSIGLTPTKMYTVAALQIIGLAIVMVIALYMIR